MKVNGSKVTKNSKKVSHDNLLHSLNQSPIAVVGIGCRFPGGSDSPAKYWEHLISGFDGIVEIPKDRWDVDSFYHPDFHVRGKMNTRKGGFIDDVKRFDPAFFDISPVEALRVDPQHRLLLEVSYQAIEDCGVTLDKLSGSSTGVFVGISSHDYGDIQTMPSERVNIGAHTNTGGAQSIASNRISYVFNLRGPSFSIDTACSSSLYAIHLACNSIWNKECDQALAGGVCLILKPEPEMGASAGGFLSPDGHCKSFDISANGYVRSEGAGMIFLKSLDAAVRDGDRIYGLIRGSVVNQDGHTNGITVPNIDAQIAMLEKAYDKAGLEPADITYVEAHGTGTAVGDPIEVNAICHALRKNNKSKVIHIGSVKSNMGHLEPASGVAGLSKLLLSMHHRQIPPNIHFNQFNPAIDFKSYNVKVPTKLIKWPKDPNKPMYAGINSFGFGGANAHLVVEGYEKQNKPKGLTKDKGPKLFVISAKTKEALILQAKQYIDFIKETKHSLAEICYNAATRRTTYTHKLALTVATKEELTKLLSSFLQDDLIKGMNYSRKANHDKPKIAFIFSGQGPQWYGMGRELYKNEPLFKKTMDDIDKILSRYADWSVVEELAKDEKESRIGETRIDQPAIMAIQIALLKMWESYGVSPEAVIGHSIGEVAAGYAAGALTLEQAVQVIYNRSRLQDKASGLGKMLAVGLGLEEANKLISGLESNVSIAAVNGIKSVTLSGDTATLEGLLPELEKQDVFHRFLKVKVPFHSHFMDQTKEELLHDLHRLKPSKASLPIYSTVTTKKEDGTHLTADYWYRNVREPVYFATGIQAMLQEGFNVFIEISPHPVLANEVMEMINHQNRDGIIVHSIRRKENEQKNLIDALGQLYSFNVPLAWEKICKGVYPPIDLPFYPWIKEEYWLELEDSRKARMGLMPHPHLTSFTRSSRESENIIWQVNLDKRTDTYIEDHRVQGPIVFPGAGHVELALSAGLNSFPDDFRFLEDIKFKRALFISDEGEPPEIQIDISSNEGNYYLYTRPRNSDNQWTLCSLGKINHLGDSFHSKAKKLNELKKRITIPVSTQGMYDELFHSGLQLGSSFRAVTQLWVGENEALSTVEVPEKLKNDFHKFNLHPAMLDACFQTMFGLWFKNASSTSRMGVFIPVGIERVGFYKPMTSKMWVHVVYEGEEGDFRNSSLVIYDDEGKVIAECQGLRGQYLKGSRGEVGDEYKDWFYEYQWELSPSTESLKNRKPNQYLAAVESLIEPLNKTLNSIKNEEKFYQYNAQFIPKMNELAVYFILNAFEKGGLDFKQDSKFQTQQLIEVLKVSNKQKQLFFYLIDLLENEKWIKKISEGHYQWIKPYNPQALMQTLSVIKHEFAAFNDDIIMFERCGESLLNVLTEEVEGTQVLFPSDKWQDIINFYHHGYSFSRYNELCKKAMMTLVKKIPKDQRIRIIEVGAGTGGVTQAILPYLPQDRTDYFFTDISQSFLSKIKSEFAKYPFIKYQVLDIEKNIEDQGVLTHSFDIVIASDVIHATKKIHDSLNAVSTLLASDGTLMLLELTKPKLSIYFVDMMFGMTSGWWGFEDERLKSGYALLSEKSWCKALQAAKFKNIQHFSDVAGTEYYGQTLFIANNQTISKEITPKNDLAARTGSWLVFSEEGQISDAIITHLTHQNKDVFVVKQGKLFKKQGNTFWITPNSLSDLAKVFQTVAASDHDFEGILYFWSWKNASNSVLDYERIIKDQEYSVMPLINMVKLFNEISFTTIPALYLITLSAQSITNKAILLSQATCWAMGRSIINEKPNMKTVLIDMGKKYDEAEFNQLCQELLVKESAFEVGFRNNLRFVNTLNHLTKSQIIEAAKVKVPARGSYYHALIKEPGVLDNIFLEKAKPEKPAKMELEIQIEATSLNFRDVMIAMGLLSDEAIKGGYFGANLGLEVSGIVTRTGEDVTKFKKGDKVLAVTRKALAGHCLALEQHTFLKPEHLSFEEASTIPLVYLTAYYSMNYLCRVQKGEWILIHAATGGVGIAAIQLAQLAGLNIIATCSPKKQSFLKKMGIKHILNSRMLDFHDQVMAITNGRGVDVVLNSLSGKAITQSMHCLAPFGRFVEIGKTDIYRNSKLDLMNLGNNISYFVVDIDRMTELKADLILQLGREIMALFEDKIINPHPYTAFPISKVSDAFKFLAQAKQIGKVVVTTGNHTISVLPPDEYYFKKDASYIVTGGCSGFGLAVAHWMAKQNAGHLILVNRNGPKTDYDHSVIREIKRLNCKVTIQKADISNAADVALLFDSIPSDLPLKGIIHAATIIHDMPVDKLDFETYLEVIKPKALGAWLLHEHSKSYYLDCFINFSSVSSVLGNHGQANYVGANHFLDQLSLLRRSNGLPATTINWGVIGETGFVSRNDTVKRLLERQGWATFTIDQAMTILNRTLLDNPVNRVAASLEWEKIREIFPHKNDSRFKHLYNDNKLMDSEATDQDKLNVQLNHTPQSEHLKLIKYKLREALAKILGADKEKLDFETSINRLGLDSLMANQLRSWIESQVNVDYSMMRIMKGPSLLELSQELLDEFTSKNQSRVVNVNQSLTDLWVKRSVVQAEPKLRLFCFPYFGGDASIYTNWHKQLGKDIEVCPIELPGHGMRSKDATFESIDLLLKELVESIRPLLDRPFAIYGHSLGAFYGYELVRYLHQHEGLDPQHFFVGSWGPIQKSTLFKEMEASNEANFDNWNVNVVKENLEKLGFAPSALENPQVIQNIIPGVKADLTLIKNYHSPYQSILDCPITVVWGSNDKLLTQNTGLGWKNYTNKGFELKEIQNASHLFINDHLEDICNIITTVCSR